MSKGRDRRRPTTVLFLWSNGQAIPLSKTECAQTISASICRTLQEKTQTDSHITTTSQLESRRSSPMVLTTTFTPWARWGQRRLIKNQNFVPYMGKHHIHFLGQVGSKKAHQKLGLCSSQGKATSQFLCFLFMASVEPESLHPHNTDGVSYKQYSVAQWRASTCQAEAILPFCLSASAVLGTNSTITALMRPPPHCTGVVLEEPQFNSTGCSHQVSTEAKWNPRPLLSLEPKAAPQAQSQEKPARTDV